MAKKDPINIGVHLEGWRFEDGDIGDLRRRGQRIAPDAYLPKMKGSMFCWYCGTNITRRPLEEARSSDGTPAYFAHIPKYKAVKCDRRTKPAPGYNFQNEEDAKRAIDRGDLVIVAGFAQDAQGDVPPAGPYAGGPVEDPNGPPAQVPIGRHRGEDFAVPGRQTTVAGICRNLNDNLSRYYVLPGTRVPQMLSEILIHSATVTDVVPDAKLYIGKIKSVYPHVYVTSVYLDHYPALPDFVLRADIHQMRAKGFSKESAGQYAMFWGPVVDNGVAYGVRGPAWGEYAIVPAQYTELLDSLILARQVR